MNTFQFKTNINCGNCVSKVSVKLDELEGVHSWKVDTDNPAKILTVETSSLPIESIIEAVKGTGFEIERL